MPAPAQPLAKTGPCPYGHQDHGDMLEKDILISETESIKEALKKLSRTGKKVLLVVDGENSLMGTITDGDIRRGLLKDKNLEDDIRDVFNKRPFYLKKEDYSLEKAKEIMLKEVIELLPIVEDGQRVTEYLTWDEAFSGVKAPAAVTKKLNIPVVIMAGGKGTRLDPFTTILPKPLIPVGDKPIVEIIIDEFRQQGVEDFYLILNHKSEMVESYFSGITKDYKLKLIKEDRFLGTAGGLKLLPDKIAETFIVSNCDVIVRANLAELINVHREKQAEMTILTSTQHYKIPYGVIAFKEQGEVVSITEKPEYTFFINTGMYVLNRTALEFIRIEQRPDEPPDPTLTTICNMDTLVSSLLSHKKKVIMYPVNENNYIDVGQWEEYKKAVEKLQFFK